MKEARVFKAHFDQIVGMVKQYLGQIVFGKTVDLDDARVWWRLMQDDARAAVVRPFVSAINTVVREEAPVELREAARPVSQTPAFVWRKDVYEGTKTVFNLVPLDSGLESAFAAFLDRAGDIAAYAKNTKQLGLTIDYVSDKGHFRIYEPDFVVRLTNGDHWLIETKGIVDPEVPRKDARARMWCEDAMELTAATSLPQRWQYARIDEDTFKSHGGRTFDGLVRHAQAALMSLPSFHPSTAPPGDVDSALPDLSSSDPDQDAPHPERATRLVETPVAEADEHFEIGVGDDPFVLVARLGRLPDGRFAVEYLTPDVDEHRDHRRDVAAQIDSYLFVLGGPDPWPYLIYHCGAAANIYSPVHWSYVPPPDQRE